MLFRKALLNFAVLAVALCQTIINVPTAIGVTQNKCTTLQISVPGNVEGLRISLQLGAVYNELSVSSMNMSFRGEDPSEDLMICSLQNELKSFPIVMTMGGTSRGQYRLKNGGYLTINVVSIPVNGMPIVAIETGGSNRTSAAYRVATSSSNCNLYYAVWDSRMRS